MSRVRNEMRKWWLLLPVLALIVAAVIPGMGSSAQAPTLVRTPPPAIYEFFDWGTNWQATHPEYGPIGAVHMILWKDINPRQGVYDFSKPDAALAKEAGITVTLRTGEVISRPVMIRLDFYLARADGQTCSGVDFWDGTPQWVYGGTDANGKPWPSVCGRKVGHVIEGCGHKAVVPAYDDPNWRNAYFAAVRALGEHYKDNPQVVAVQINTGIDGETQITKDASCNWGSLAGQQVSGLSYRFQQFLVQAEQVYREAFPSTLVLIANAPGGSGVRSLAANTAATLVPPVGMINAGMWVDNQNHTGWGGEIGTWDMYSVYSQTLPIWVESAYGFGSPELFYWGWYAGLHYHPVGTDVHEAWITQSDPAWLRFVNDHLGRTLADTPDVWTVLRDREFEPQTWGSAGHSGHNGDWTFWAYRTSDNPRVWRKDMPVAAQAAVYARQARLVDPAHPLTVQVDPRVWFAGQPARVRVISYGELTLDGRPGTVTDAGNGWIETAWTSTADTITLQGSSAYVHRVLVQPDEVVEAPTPTPTPRPLAEQVRDAAWNAAGVPYNPEAAFAIYAREHGLGNPITAEIDLGGYRLQGFAGGIVYAPIGRWNECRHVGW